MQKIEALRITGLKISGFKCFRSEARFEFGDTTYITGDNHVGKTSIADALAFVVTGKPFFGEKAIDKLYNEEFPSIEVSMQFKGSDSASHEVSRKRERDKMSVTYDGYSIRQADLDLMFGDPDVFLSIFNPLYFIEELGADGKRLLELYVPFIEHDRVLEKLTEHDRALLEHESLMSPETYISKLREEIRNMEETITALGGQYALLAQQRKDNAQSLLILQNRMLETNEAIEALEKEMIEGLDITALENERIAQMLRYDELLADRPQPIDTSALDVEIQKATAAFEACKVKVYESSYREARSEIGTDIIMATKEFMKLTKLQKELAPGMRCPSCLRAVTTDNLEDIRAELQKQLTEVIAKGKSLKLQEAQLAALDAQSEQTFTQFRTDDLASLSEKLKTLSDRRSTENKVYHEEATNHAACLAAFNGQLQNLNALIENGNLDASEGHELLTLRDTKRQIAADLAALKCMMEQEPPNLKKQMADTEQDIKSKKEMVFAATEYLGARADLTFADLSTENVRISLFDVVKTTGELKNVFRFTYQGRDYRRLSHSEKIRAGMEMSMLLGKLTGRTYPVFVDDAESVTRLPRPAGQIFISRVVRGADLSVESKDTAHPLKKAS